MKKKTVALITSVAATMLLSITANAEDNAAEGAYVAQVNSGEKYTSLQAAVGAAAANDTVKLLGDIHLNESVEVASDDDLTIDLNGYTITVDQTGGRSLYAINNYGDCTVDDTSEDEKGTIISRGMMNYNLMTIEGGTIDSCDSNGGGASVWNEGVLYIKGGVLKVSGEAKDNSSAALVNNNVPEGKVYITGGRFESPRTSFFNFGYMEITGVELSVSTQYWHAVKTYGGSYTELNNVKINASLGGGMEAAGGDIVLNNCNIIQSNYYDYNSCCAAVSNGGTLEINGGTYDSENYGFYVFSSGGTIDVNDCDLKASKNALKADNTSNGWGSNINVYGGNLNGTVSIGSTSKLNVYGGTYTADVSNYLADGAAYKKTDDNQYVVISDKNKATEDGTYKTLVKDNDKYDQMTLATKAIEGTTVASNIAFDIKFNDEEPFKYNYKGTTTFTDATVMLGLIITDIPKDEVVTVTID